jgi:hypothetical protein
VLGCNTYLCVFFLQAHVPSQRIFFDLDAGAHLAPSGVVSGGVAGALIWRLVGCCGEDEGPNRVFNFYFEILFAKLEDLVVISFSLRILYVNLCTLPY